MALPVKTDQAPSRWQIRSSLRSQLIVVSIVLVLIGAGLRNALLISFLQGELESEVAGQVLSIARYVARDVNGKLQERQNAIARLAAALPSSVISHPREANRWLTLYGPITPQFPQGLMLISPAGRVLYASPEAATRVGSSYGDQDWFQTVVKQAPGAAGRPVIHADTREPIIVFSTPIKNGQGKIIGVLASACSVREAGFLDLLQESKVGEHGGFLLISPQDRLFVAASDPSMTLKPTPPPGVNGLHDRAMAGYRGTGITVNARGIEELSAMVSVPLTDWFLVARIPTKEAFAPVAKVQHFVWLGNLLVALGTVIIMFFGLRWAFLPLTNASSQVRAMADGTQPLAPLPVVRLDEVGDLATGFNSLLDQLQQREAFLAKLAHQDALTSLPNRIALHQRMEQSIALAQRQGDVLAVLFLDLDGFKPINDVHGHETGDEVLRQVADRLRKCVRKSDTVSRYGGDEFVLLLVDVAGADFAAKVADKCIAEIGQPFQAGPLTLGLGASIGIALYPEQANTAETLLAAADAAMYQAKHEGRNTYRFSSTPASSSPPTELP